MVEKAKIGDRLYNVRPYEEYITNPNNATKFDAIQKGDYIYPIRTKTDTAIGLYNAGPMIFFVKPETEEDRATYSSSNSINFSDATSLREYMKMQDQLKTDERTILTKVDNIFEIPVGPNNTPHMAALRQAINDKGIDIEKYEGRFGANFNNDIRILAKDDITMSKLKLFVDKLDMKATLIIEDAAPDVPNPIGHAIMVDLNSSESNARDALTITGPITHF